MRKGIWLYEEIEELELGKRVAGHIAFEEGCFSPEQLSKWLEFLITESRYYSLV